MVLDVAQELRETYDLSTVKVISTSTDSPLTADSYTLNLDDDEPSVAIPLRSPRQRRRRHELKGSDTPLEKIDTRTTPEQHEPLITRQKLVRVANNPWTVQIVGGTVSGVISGTIVGVILLIIAE